jgi:hypothetical protein
VARITGISPRYSACIFFNVDHSCFMPMDLYLPETSSY